MAIAERIKGETLAAERIIDETATAERIHG
jgi:hypothetical protein